MTEPLGSPTMVVDHMGAGVRRGVACCGHAMVYASALNLHPAACAHARW